MTQMTNTCPTCEYYDEELHICLYCMTKDVSKPAQTTCNHYLDIWDDLEVLDE